MPGRRTKSQSGPQWLTGPGRRRTVSAGSRRAGAVALAVTLVAAGVSLPGEDAAAGLGPDVRISELTNGGPGGSADNFIELTNYGDGPADLDGWKVWRCSGTGLSGSAPQAELTGVTLEPGGTYLLASSSSTVRDLADEVYADSLADAGFGVWLEDGERRRVGPIDAVGVYAAPTESDCGATSLPNDLDYRRGQSYQRVATTGDVHRDFIKAERTPGAPNATEPDDGPTGGDVLISELTNGGPGGSSDNFIELANLGDQAVNVGGWAVYRCTGTGRRQTTTLQATLPAGTTIEPGDVFVVAHQSVDLPDGTPNTRYTASLANVGFGAIVEDGGGVVVDAVGVYETDAVHQPATDSPCTRGTALSNRLDYGFDQTYQRARDTGDNAADFVVGTRAVGELVEHPPADGDPEDFEFGPIRISELTNGGPAGATDQYFELANHGDEPVDLEGWAIHRCGADGRRVAALQVPVLTGVILDPGETYLAVRSGSSLHAEGIYDAVYGTGFSGAGFGLVVFDAEGELVDRVGVYDPVSDVGQGGYSACTKGLSLPNSLDTASGASYQRLRSSGRDVDDFVAAERNPGELADDLRDVWDLTDAQLAPIDVAPNPRPLPAALASPEIGAQGVDHDAPLTAIVRHSTGGDVDLVFRGAERIELAEGATRTFTGVSDTAPPTERRPRGETRVTGTGVPTGDVDGRPVAESRTGFPYQRFQLVVPGNVDTRPLEVAWSGRSTNRNELQLYAWDHRDGRWRLLDVGGGLTGGEITLIGALNPDTMVRGRAVEILVQDGPGTAQAFSDETEEPNRAFKDPAEYDLALGFVTDTQFLSEGYRDVFASMNRWLVTNESARKIAYSIHAGDVIESWTRGTHPEARAREEFTFASNVMAILEDAGHPHGLTPGNHDNRWGRSNDLFNEFFPPARYAQQPWYGGAWREGDNQNHYDLIEAGGTELLLLYLGYASGGDETIRWANDVLAEHPDHDAIFVTHDYLRPDGSLSTPDSDRWTAHGDRYWEEVILPNDNVFLAVSGHVHGVALNIKRDVGGISGRTVVEMVANYQGFERDGRRDTGFLRLLQIDVDARTMAVNTFSPHHDEHNAWRYDPLARYVDQDDEFTVEIDLNDHYDKRVATRTLGLQRATTDHPIGQQVGEADQEVSQIWAGLEPATTYHWYVEAEGPGEVPVRSPLWTFTTAG